MIKDEAELALIRRAAGIIDGAFAAVRDGLRAGRTELEVYEDAVRAILLAHGEPFTMECVFISGPRTLEIVGPPTARQLARGDLLLFDVFPYLHGYKVDVTRTFCVGPATDEQRQLHALLERALAAGVAALRPGATGGAVDAATRGVIAAAGYGAHSTHHMGHAIGLFHPERPSIVPGETLPLAEGMVITLEPGVYVPGIGGLRLEQNYVVRDGPPEALSQFPLELIEVT
jgi:Xaa-Pro aminopeptidase